MTRTMTIALFLLLALATPLSAQEETPETLPMDVPVMVEEALAAGIDHEYTGPWEYFVGGGASAFDCNGDRLPDLAIAGGTSPAALYVNGSDIGGELRFEEKPDALPAAARDKVTGFYALDIDNDGYRDLVTLRVGENAILKGGPDCSFTEANRAFAFDGGRAWSTAFAAMFEPGNTYPTLAFGNYVDRSAPGSPWGTCHDNAFIRPLEEKDTPDYSEPTALSPGYCALSMIFTDWNHSGEPDLRIANDRQYYREGQEQLWRIQTGRPPRPYRRNDGWQRLQIWGMGIAEADLNADGYPEYALTSMGDTMLQTLDDEAEPDRPVYRDIAFDNNATAHRPYTGDDLKPSTGWHAEFQDFNNDGRLDLYIAKGNVQQMQDFASYDPDNLLLGKAGGGFLESGDRAGIALPRRGRGAAIADFNMDGMLDLAVVNREAPVSLFRNTGGSNNGSKTRPMGNWLEIELQQKGINRNAVGATVTVKSGNETRTRKVQVGGGHASGSSGFIHVGTGVAERAQIRIQWPDGEWSAPFRVFANNFVVIRRDATQAQYWYPPVD